MSTVMDNGGRKEWNALVKVYEHLYSAYPDFGKQIQEFGYSTIESNDKGELILEIGNKESDIVVDKASIIKILKKAGLKKFSNIESLTLDKVLEYDYDMAKGLLNILVRRDKKSTLSLNLHFYYIEGEGIPKLEEFLVKRETPDWSEEVGLNEFTKVFNMVFISKLDKEGLYWVHMDGESLLLSVVSNGEVVENRVYGDDEKLDETLGKLLNVLTEMFSLPVKEILLLGDDISKVRCRKNSDGEITVVMY